MVAGGVELAVVVTAVVVTAAVSLASAEASVAWAEASVAWAEVTLAVRIVGVERRHDLAGGHRLADR